MHNSWDRESDVFVYDSYVRNRIVLNKNKCEFCRERIVFFHIRIELFNLTIMDAM